MALEDGSTWPSPEVPDFPCDEVKEPDHLIATTQIPEVNRRSSSDGQTRISQEDDRPNGLARGCAFPINHGEMLVEEVDAAAVRTHGDKAPLLHRRSAAPIIAPQAGKRVYPALRGRR